MELGFWGVNIPHSLSQWPRGLRRESEAARLLGLWVRITPRTGLSVSCECCVSVHGADHLSGRVLPNVMGLGGGGGLVPLWLSSHKKMPYPLTQLKSGLFSNRIVMTQVY